MSQDSWEDSIWAQPEPSPPEADGADHRGDEVKDGLPVTALTKEANGSNKMTHHLAGLVGVIAGCIDREIVQRAISETLLEQDSDAYRIRPTRPLPHQAHRYHLYNHVCKPIVREALGQQGDEVRLSKVHAYLLKELGVNASKDELRPIVEDLLDQQDFEQDRDEANERGQPLTREYIQRHHGSYFRRSLLPEWMTAASPFDGATKITKHNAWRYDRLKPLLNSKYRDKASRTPDSEPARFYRQLMSNEWDGETRSYQLACREFERLVRIGKSRNRRVEVQQHSKRQCTIPATAETTPSNAHQTTAATPTPLPALVSAAALSVAAESHTRACERVSHLLEQERGRWRELYMTAALNAAFTAQPAATDPAALEPMMSAGESDDAPESMTAALNAAFTVQPIAIDPAAPAAAFSDMDWAPEPMMSGAGLAESNDTASEAAGEPADCDPGGGTLTEGTVCSDLSEDTYLPPECRHDEKHIRKFKDREAYHRAMADFFYERICNCENNEYLEDQRREFDGETRITKDNEALFVSDAPSLRDYRDKAMRTRDSLPARFYRMVMGKEWDGEGHSYSLAKKRYRRLNPDDPYQQKERQRQQQKKRDYSKKKRPTDDNNRRQARRKAQRERKKAAASMAV